MIALLVILSEPTVMSSELTRDVYCCNTELNCTQCNDCNQTIGVGLKCRTHQETTGRTASTAETTTAQNQSGDGGSLTAVIVVLVLATATGCMVICIVVIVVWKRISARKNSIKLR